MMKYANIPFYFMNARCGEDFMQSKGYSVATIGENDVTDWENKKIEDPYNFFVSTISIHPLKQPRTERVNGTP
jgi:hypothetical protein